MRHSGAWLKFGLMTNAIPKNWIKHSTFSPSPVWSCRFGAHAGLTSNPRDAYASTRSLETSQSPQTGGRTFQTSIAGEEGGGDSAGAPRRPTVLVAQSAYRSKKDNEGRKETIRRARTRRVTSANEVPRKRSAKSRERNPRSRLSPNGLQKKSRCPNRLQCFN
jgi:hypothetical protein